MRYFLQRHGGLTRANALPRTAWRATSGPSRDEVGTRRAQSEG
jgi:hypothetical protein